MRVTSMLHLFDPLFISGQKGSLIDQKYVIPLLTAPQVEIIGLYPDHREHTELLELIRRSFQISETEYAYEVRLRGALSELWCSLLETAKAASGSKEYDSRVSDKVKSMMVYIHEHCGEKITVAQVASSVFISERECFRLFQDCLKMTPVEYMIGYRLQRACHMLAETDENVTDICQACGLGSSSYFSRIFHRRLGCTPLEYRRDWRDSAMIRQE